MYRLSCVVVQNVIEVCTIIGITVAYLASSSDVLALGRTGKPVMNREDFPFLSSVIGVCYEFKGCSGLEPILRSLKKIITTV